MVVSTKRDARKARYEQVVGRVQVDIRMYVRTYIANGGPWNAFLNMLALFCSFQHDPSHIHHNTDRRSSQVCKADNTCDSTSKQDTTALKL